MTLGAYLLQLQRQNPSGEIVHMLVCECRRYYQCVQCNAFPDIRYDLKKGTLEPVLWYQQELLLVWP